MNNFGPKNNSTNKQQRNNQSFASALVESEKNSSQREDKKDNPLNSFATALNSSVSEKKNNPFEKMDLLKKQKKEALRKKLHDQVNPVNNFEIFSAKEKQNKEDLRQVREELKMLMKDLKDLNKEIDVSVSQNIAEPGSEEAIYYRNFFHQLKQLIMLLRQKVQSARTWAQQMNVRGKKRKGLNMKTGKGVHQSMNNERNFGANSVG